MSDVSKSGRDAVTRRDFMGTTLAGAGASLLLSGCGGTKEAEPGASANLRIDPKEAKAFNGFGGEGQYSSSNGNTWGVLNSGHQLRDELNGEALLDSAGSTNEDFDLVIVGGGPAGLGAAYYYQKARSGRGKVLILDNHPIFGGEAKENVFDVDGVKLVAPQGSNLLFTPSGEGFKSSGDDYLREELKDLGLLKSYKYANLTGTDRKLDFDRTNYMFLWTFDHSDSVGLRFDDTAFGGNGKWVRNAWSNNLDGLGIDNNLKSELLRWRHDLNVTEPLRGDLDAWLDSMSYRTFLTDVHKLPVEVADFAEPYVASAVGLGSSAVSAYAVVKHLDMPGLRGNSDPLSYPSLAEESFVLGDTGLEINGFPGGNGSVARSFARYLVPAAFDQNEAVEAAMLSEIDVERLDERGAPTRIRTGSTVLRTKKINGGSKVEVVYEKGGRLYSSIADNVVMANGGWVGKHIVRDMPEDIRAAYDTFNYASVIVANVAVRNWKFLEQIGITACLYTGGEFGFSCNIRRPMHLGGYTPPLDPNEPAILTFYAPLIYPGEDAAGQGARARWEIFSTSFSDYEGQIRRQMDSLFGDYGFDAERDIAGIILNRWGHAYVNPYPGFFFGKDGKAAAPDVVREGFGNIQFASAELRGLQNYRGAVYEAGRAVQKILA